MEKPVFLDTRRAPSMTDVMAYGRNAIGEPVVVAVEGKADEVFASRVATWVRGDANTATSSAVRPSREARLKFLSGHLGVTIDASSNLRYQLLHRTVSAVLEAQLHGAALAVIIVHAFGPAAQDNWQDFLDFLHALNAPACAKGAVAGPCLLGEAQSLPTYFLWWQQATAGAQVS